MRLEEAAARRRFAGARVARLATVGETGRPHLVPVTFAVEGDILVTAVDQKPKRDVDLRRVRNIRADPRVTLLADHYDDDWRELWWVRADGSATLVADDAGRRGPLRLLRDKYPQYGSDPPRGPVLRVRVERWTGWAYR
ncbi:MAG: TIGR03668 family PPOX class F420-dependent oxidoreductase [Carbonactinosporaceae bacterium]